MPREAMYECPKLETLFSRYAASQSPAEGAALAGDLVGHAAADPTVDRGCGCARRTFALARRFFPDTDAANDAVAHCAGKIYGWVVRRAADDPSASRRRVANVKHLAALFATCFKQRSLDSRDAGARKHEMSLTELGFDAGEEPVASEEEVGEGLPFDLVEAVAEVMTHGCLRDERCDLYDAQRHERCRFFVSFEKRQAAVLHLQQDLTFREIGELTVCSLQGAYSRYTEALKQARACLEHNGWTL